MDISAARKRLELAQHGTQHIAVLTGAGISAESGIPTFRGEEGLWKNCRPEELATPQAYAMNPNLVWEWYAMRTNTVLQAEPNNAHKALAKLSQEKDLTLVTQNVDGLHQRGGAGDVLELHGNITHSRCEVCQHLDILSLNFEHPPKCSQCKNRARPNVVWFGESLPQDIFQKAIQAFENCDVALIIGTSAVVEPAASLGRLAASQNAYVIEINPTPTPLSSIANCVLNVGAVEGMSLLTS